MSIESVKRKLEKQLLQLPNIIGVGIGEKAKKMVIKVYVNSRIPNSSAEQTIPKTLDGYEIEIEEIGDVKSLHRK